MKITLKPADNHLRVVADHGGRPKDARWVLQLVPEDSTGVPAQLTDTSGTYGFETLEEFRELAPEVLAHALGFKGTPNAIVQKGRDLMDRLITTGEVSL